MTCNSNTNNLVDVENLDCNGNCVPSEINIVCRKMIIPANQQNIAVQNDNNSSSRTFILPLTSESGDSFNNKAFYLSTINASGNVIVVQFLDQDIIIGDNYIKLIWKIDKQFTSVAGKLNVQIKVTGENFLWQTLTGTFNILSSISNTIN